MQVSYARTSIIAYNSIDCLALIPECLTMHLIKTINLFHIDFKQIISSSTRLWTWHAAWSSKLIESHKCQDSTYTSKVVFLNQHSCWRYWRGALCPSVTSDFFFFCCCCWQTLNQLIRKMIRCFEALKTRHAGDPCWSCINMHKNTF